MGQRLLQLGGDDGEDYEVMMPFQALQVAGRPIAAICHGLQILAAARTLKGRKAASDSAAGPELEWAGGAYQDIPVDQAFVDGKPITVPAWPAHPQWLARFPEVLGTRIEA